MMIYKFTYKENEEIKEKLMPFENNLKALIEAYKMLKHENICIISIKREDKDILKLVKRGNLK